LHIVYQYFFIDYEKRNQTKPYYSSISTCSPGVYFYCNIEKIAMPIIVNLDVMMAKRKISLNELSERVNITPANLSILKTGKAKAIRFSTLEAICKELNCQPGDLLEWEEEST
jgi:putative transcriptional regulator